MSTAVAFGAGALLVLAMGALVRVLVVAQSRRSVAGRLGEVRPPRSRWPVAAWRESTSLLLFGRRRASDERYQRELPEVLTSLARALRAGTPFASALHEAAGSTTGVVGRDLALAADGLGQGRPLADVLAEWASRRALIGVRLAVAALLLGTEVGGSRARAVERVASRLRDHAAAAREVQALSTQARLSAVVIGVAPLVFAILGMAGDGELSHFLLATPAGWACVVGGLVLDGAAALWMRHVVREAAT